MAWRSPHIPDYKRQRRNGDNNRYENTGDNISNPLNRRFGALRFLHYPDNLGQCSITPYLVGLNLQHSVLVHGGPDHRITRLLFNRYTLACQHRFINRRESLYNLTVHRDLSSRFHQYNIPGYYLFYRDADLGPIADNKCSLGLQAH
ncbi:hypothetical protein D3C75_612660 [compost metagenome]